MWRECEMIACRSIRKFSQELFTTCPVFDQKINRICSAPKLWKAPVSSHWRMTKWWPSGDHFEDSYSLSSSKLQVVLWLSNFSKKLLFEKSKKSELFAWKTDNALRPIFYSHSHLQIHRNDRPASEQNDRIAVKGLRKEEAVSASASNIYQDVFAQPCQAARSPNIQRLWTRGDLLRSANNRTRRLVGK